MTEVSGKNRSDSASRVIRASPRAIYEAFLDPEAVASWRPPEGMTCQIYAFDPREGGTFRMSFAYMDTDHTERGKTSEHADVFQGRFLELVPNERIVELVEFESDDPAFAGAMTIITTLAAVAAGTEVTILCENVPSGIRPGDHQIGMTSTLKNLASFTE
jgi:uncharacterized protein YndB with AHSA1/START domain